MSERYTSESKRAKYRKARCFFFVLECYKTKLWLHPGGHYNNFLISFLLLPLALICYVKKTVCMVFNPKCRSNIVAQKFPSFTINNEPLQFVQEFKYLGHILSNTELDDGDSPRKEKFVLSM